MADFLKPLGLAALLAFASPTLAQDTGDTTAADGAEAAPAASEAPAATEAEAAPAPSAEEAGISPVYVDETFTDWARECVRLPEGTEGDDPCLITQLLKNGEGRIFGKFNVRRLPQGARAVAQADVFVALELVPYLPAGLSLGVDKGLAKEYQYQFCRPATGCLAQPNLSQADIEAFKAGDVLTMSFAIVTPGNEVAGVNGPISLKGFTAAWESLAAPAAAAAQ